MSESSQNKPFVIVCAVALVIALGACLAFWKGGHGAQASQTLKFGAILPLSGDAAQYGNNDREGILLAVNQANAAGGIDGRSIAVSFEDCQSEAKTAISAFNKLRAEGVEILVDDAISTISLAMTPLLAQNHTVLLSTGASNPSLSGISPWFFRIWNSDAYEGVVAADYLKRQTGLSKVAILYINTDYGRGLYEVMTKALEGSSVRVVASETYDKTARELRAQIAKIKDTAPDCVYLIGYAPQTGPAAQQLREGGVTARILGTVAMEDPEFIKLAGGASEDVVYPFAAPPGNAAADKFKADFKAAYGKESGLLHDCGFDAANLIIQAMRQGARTGEEVRAKLAATKDFQGASGSITFDQNGDVHKPMQIKTIKNGAFVTLPTP